MSSREGTGGRGHTPARPAWPARAAAAASRRTRRTCRTRRARPPAGRHQQTLSFCCCVSRPLRAGAWPRGAARMPRTPGARARLCPRRSAAQSRASAVVARGRSCRVGCATRPQRLVSWHRTCAATWPTSARERPSGEVVELGDTPLGASALGIMVHKRAVWRLAGRGWALRALSEP